MEKKYYRDGRHSYLVLGSEMIDESRYEYRILPSNEVAGILDCSIRTLNGDKYLYYELGSRQSLLNMYEGKGMSFGQMKALFKTIGKTLDALDSYLLDYQAIVFDISAIFVNIQESEFGLVYCPFYEGEKSFSHFCEQMLDLCQSDDEEAIAFIYKMCELSQNECMLIKDIIEETCSDEEMDHDKQQCISAPEKELYSANLYEESFDIEEQQTIQPIQQKESNKKNDPARTIYLIVAIVSTLILLGLFYLRREYILSYRISILSMAGMALSAILSVACLARFFLANINKDVSADSENSNANMMSMEDDGYDDIYDDIDSSLYDPVSDRHVTKAGQNSEGTVCLNEPCENSCGETVVLSHMPKRDMHLYSTSLDHTVNINLSNLPVTVGKLKGMADAIVDDGSVSRLHAKIFKDAAGDICLKDLGSTNGTYHNGVKLESQERVVLARGDEITFGGVVFNCR